MNDTIPATTNMKVRTLLFAGLLACSLLSCRDLGTEDKPHETTDSELLALAQTPGNWVYYRNSGDTLVKASGSAHDEPRLRTRYNIKATSQLDQEGRVKPNPDFPDSSLIVKELYTGSVVTTFAIMFKLSDASNAGAGWIWSELTPGGEVKISASKKGVGCVPCHSSGLDHTRMNDSHP